MLPQPSAARGETGLFQAEHLPRPARTWRITLTVTTPLCVGRSRSVPVDISSYRAVTRGRTQNGPCPPGR